MTAMTPEFVARALGEAFAPCPHDWTRPFTGTCTDSRQVEPGNLFVALGGQRADGHTFVDHALRRGARGVICRRDASVALPEGVWRFPVADTLEAYRTLAWHWRRQFAVPVVAVAGSAGKTTTKELLGAILSGKHDSVLATQESRNGFVGVPRTLLQLAPCHRSAVIEVGIDEPGAMLEHMALVGATVSIVTTIGPEHLEKLVDVPTVAREESYALSMVADAGGTIVVNLDDPWLRPFHADRRSGCSVGYSMYGEHSGDDVLRGTMRDSVIVVSGLGLQETAFRLPLPGAHNAANLLGAIAIARILGLSKDEIEGGMSRVLLPDGRSELYELPGSVRVICDFYNANPASMAAGLELLSSLACASKRARARWACLADMLELGDASESYHRELASRLAELEIEHVLLVGPKMRRAQEHLRALGFHADCRHFATHAELADTLAREATKDAVVLIKGSRGMRMEQVWAAFVATRQASVRRCKVWDVWDD